MFQELPVSSSKLCVWAFIPYRIQGQELVSEFDVFRQELANAFAELGIAWKWQPITVENMHSVVEEVVASSSECIPIVLNVCDGNEIGGYPDISIFKLLEAKNIIFTGADYAFQHLCLSKIRMKRAFLEAGVPTAPYEVISDINSVQGICARLGTPLIVKPAMAFGSVGIYEQSIVHSDEQATAQVQRLLSGEHGIQFPPDSIIVEQFINGPEFTVFLLGSAQQPENIKIYPPLEMVFHSNLQETQRFFSYNKKWGKHENESSLSPSDSVCHVQLVAHNLQDKLCSLSKRAYCAIDGTGYARVDIRMDNATQELFVLEVNSSCQISSKPFVDLSDPVASQVGSILHLSGTPFAKLMSEIIAEAFTRHSTKSRPMSKTA